MDARGAIIFPDSAESSTPGLYEIYMRFIIRVQAGPEAAGQMRRTCDMMGGQGLRTVDRSGSHMQNMGQKGAIFRQARILGTSPSGLRRGASCGARVVGVAEARSSNRRLAVRRGLER